MNSDQPTVVNRHSTPAELESALWQIYAQILERQPYAYERKQLAKAEKEFISDKIGVRRFLRELGHSQVYLNSFYHNHSNMKFLELCFKHFLGRAPIDQEEIKFYCEILMHKGVGDFITAILDSEEYRKAFGCFTVPYARSLQCYSSPKAYTESCLLNHEHPGQRGRSIPTIYWHQLGLNCEGGACDRHLITERAIASRTDQVQNFQHIGRSRPGMSRVAAATQSPTQKEMVRRAMAKTKR
jgi:phycoerythrin-associated linker protein